MAMAQQPRPNTFQRALDKFIAAIPPAQRTEFEKCTLKDVHDTIKAIQKTQASEKRMRNMNRLKGFLEAMQNYAQMIDALLNSTIYLGFVWVRNSRLRRLQQNN